MVVMVSVLQKAEPHHLNRSLRACAPAWNEYAHLFPTWQVLHPLDQYYTHLSSFQHPISPVNPISDGLPTLCIWRE